MYYGIFRFRTLMEMDFPISGKYSIMLLPVTFRCFLHYDYGIMWPALLHGCRKITTKIIEINTDGFECKHPISFESFMEMASASTQRAIIWFCRPKNKENRNRRSTGRIMLRRADAIHASMLRCAWDVYSISVFDPFNRRILNRESNEKN